MNIDQYARRSSAVFSKSSFLTGFVLLGLVSCGGETTQQYDMGTLELPLRATANGHTYQLFVSRVCPSRIDAMGRSRPNRPRMT